MQADDLTGSGLPAAACADAGIAVRGRAASARFARHPIVAARAAIAARLTAAVTAAAVARQVVIDMAGQGITRAHMPACTARAAQMTAAGKHRWPRPGRRSFPQVLQPLPLLRGECV